MDFTPVERKKRNRKNRTNKAIVVVEKTVEDHLSSLKEKRQAIEGSEFIAQLNDILTKFKVDTHPIKHIRCLALGSPTDWFNAYSALHQLALLQVLMAKLKVTSVSAWDPVFTADDREIFENLDISVDETDDSSYSDYECLYYMPHAPIELLDAVLQRTESLVIIGNDLTAFRNHLDENIHVKTASELIESGKLQAEVVKDDAMMKQQYWQAFNGTTVTVKDQKLDEELPLEVAENSTQSTM